MTTDGAQKEKDIPLKSRQTPCYIARSSQCPTTGVTKAVVCVILSVG